MVDARPAIARLPVVYFSGSWAINEDTTVTTVETTTRVGPITTMAAIDVMISALR